MTRPRFFRRIAALLVDYCLILGWAAVIAAISAGIALASGGYANGLAGGTGMAELLGFVFLVLPIGIYLFATEASPRQATVGKRALRMRVVARDGSRPPAWRILVRTIVKLLPWEVAHFFVWHAFAVVSGDGVFPAWLIAGLVVADLLPVAYVLTVLLEPQRRGPHDLVAGTRVVMRD
ncbi:MAG: RDD family protein [Pseudolysinimonas sp.]